MCTNINKSVSHIVSLVFFPVKINLTSSLILLKVLKLMWPIVTVSWDLPTFLNSLEELEFALYISCVHLYSNGTNTTSQGYTVKWALFLYINGFVAFTLDWCTCALLWQHYGFWNICAPNRTHMPVCTLFCSHT